MLRYYVTGVLLLWIWSCYASILVWYYLVAELKSYDRLAWVNKLVRIGDGRPKLWLVKMTGSTIRIKCYECDEDGCDSSLLCGWLFVIKSGAMSGWFEMMDEDDPHNPPRINPLFLPTAPLALPSFSYNPPPRRPVSSSGSHSIKTN